MKTWLVTNARWILASLLVAAAIGPAYAQDLDLTDAERAFIETHPVIKVGGEIDWAPFDFVNDQGQYTGIANDFLKLVAAQTGLRFEVETDSFNQLLMKFERGELDLLPALYYNEERAKKHHFTSKYHQVTEYFFARDDADISSPGDLPGKTVALVRGFSSVANVREIYPELKILEVGSVDEAINAIVTYKAELLFDGLAVLSYTLRQKSITNIHPVFVLEGSKPYDLFMASPKGLPELAAIIDKVLVNTPESEKQAILSNWLGGVGPVQTADSGELTKTLDLSEEEQAWISDHPVIRVHNEMDFPPFNFNEDGQPTGFSIDFMNLVTARVGLQVEYISGPSWQEFLDMMRAGQLDVIANATPTEERRDYMRFTSVFFEQPLAVVVEDSTTGINTLDDLAGKRVAVVEGFTQQQFMEDNYPTAELILQDDLLDCLYSVLEGRSDAMIASLPPAKYLIDKQSLVGLRVAVISRDPDLISKNALAVRKDRPVLRDILQKGMDVLEDTELTALRQKWFGLESAKASGAGRPELTSEERAWVSEHPSIRVHNEMDWPPFNFNVDGQPTGFSIDFMNLVTARVGLQVEYISGPTWQEFLDMVQSDELDVMLNLISTPERAEYLNFTDPYLQSSATVVVKGPTLQVNSIQDLYRVRVAVTKGFITEEFLTREHPDIELVLEPDTLGALFAVVEGRAEAMLDDFPVTNYLINQHALTGLRFAYVTRDPGLAPVIALGVRKDWPALRDILQKGIDAVDESEITALRQKWLGAVNTQASSAQGLEFTTEERAWLSEHPSIRVSNEMNWPPFNFNENGQPKGFSIDLMNLVAANAGLNVQYVNGPSWTEFKVMLASDQLDVLLNVDTTPPAPDYAIFTTSYATMSTAVFVNDPDIEIDSLNDLDGLRVAVTRGFSSQAFMEREHPGAELLPVDTLQDAVFAVMDGRADAVIDDFPAINYIIQKNTLTGMRVALMTSTPELSANTAIGVRKDWQILRNILQKALDGVDPDAINDLRIQWLGQPTVETEEQRGLSNTIYWLVGITLAVFLLLIVLNRVSSHYSKGEGVGLQTGTSRFRIIILGSLSIFVALVGILGWLALNSVKEKILHDLGNNLEGVLITTAQRLDIWVAQQANVLAQIVKNPTLLQQTESLLEVAVNPVAIMSSEALSDIRILLNQYKDSLGLGFFIISPDGVSIASARNANIGTQNLIAVQRPDLLQRVFQGEAVLIPPIHSDVAIGQESQSDSTSLFIAVPVKREDGEVLAALTIRLDPGEGFSRVLQFSRVGESGESYAFDSTGTLLSASRFEDDLRAIGLLESGQSSVMNIQIRDPGGNMTEGFRAEISRTELPLTHMAGNVIAAIGESTHLTGEEHTVIQKGLDGYRDYRGVPVFGAWLWDETLGLGLTSEIDVAEAFSTFSTIRTLSLSVLGVTLFLTLGGVLFILSTGERTNRVLRKAKDELEDRVEERTKDLSKANEETSLILQNATDGILTIDDEQIVVRFNPACEAMWGYSAEEVLGKEITMLLPEYIRKDHLDHVHRFRDAEANEQHVESRGLKLFGLTKDGVIFSAEVGISKNEVDGALFYSAFIKDITQREKADAEILQAKKTADDALDELENVSSVILRWSPDATICSINSYGMELFGFSEQELIGKSLFGTIVRDIEEARAGIESLVKNIVVNPEEYFSLEGQNCNSDGKDLWMSWSNNPILEEGGSLKEILAIGHDITQRKMLEAELEEAMNVATEATKAKGDFLANMSHEIRTPMNAIMGLSDLALRTDLNAKQQDYLGKIYASAESLLGIINDILDFSKIEAGKLDMEHVSFEIDQVLDNLATVVTVKTQEKGLELLFSRDSEVPPMLIGDGMRLGQVMVNLVNNAVKFTESGEIVVKVEVLEMQEDDAMLQFSVRDTGIGMNEEQQGRMFKSFSQADTSTTRKYGGTGLGLAISKQLVEMMGGKIWVESEPDVGSTFIFTAKLGVGDASEQRVLVPVNKELRSIHALVVDDNATSREILTTYLESFTFKVTTAENAEDALEMLKKGEDLPELILMDWLMPGLNGLEAAEKIKQELKLENDPHIVLVSAFSSSRLIDKPEAKYIDNFLSKPVSPSHLFDAVMEAFGEKVAGSARDHVSGRQAEMEALQPIQGASLLVVEDNEINQQVARELLEQALFRVEIANHGAEAISMLNEAEFDCVLMDCQMPVMDGFTATRELRNDDRFKELPILAMTANATLEDQKRCKDAGMDDHIAKPIIPKVLFETLLKWVEQKDYEVPDAPDDGEGAVAVELPQLPGIDTEAGVARVGGNINSYLKLLGKFAENQANAINEIRSAFGDSDHELSVRLAHTLKGVGGAIGATALQEASAKLEATLKEGPKELPKKLLSVAERELDQIIALLGELFAAGDESGDSVPGSLPDDLPDRLKTLLEKLEEYDSEAEDLVFEMMDLVKGTEIYDSLLSLKKLVGQYDFETAAEELKPLIEKYS